MEDTVQRPKANAFTVLLLLVIVVIQAFAAFAPKPVHWEYMIQDVPDDQFTQQMNALGHNGWDLTFARRASDGADSSTMSYEVILKRQVAN